MTSRADLIAAAWSATSWQFPADYTADDFTAAVEGWEFWPVVVGGVLAGAIMANGPELHCCIKPAFLPALGHAGNVSARNAAQGSTW